MKIKKNIGAYVIAGILGLFVTSPLVYADQCDEIFDKADATFESAKEAVGQKNYDRAAELYKEAAEYYEQVAHMQNCRCPKIVGASQKNAILCRKWADTCQKVMEDYKKEVKLYEEYVRAQEKYNEGNNYAQNRAWDKAIAAFEEAAQIWEDVSAATQSENGKRAAVSAQQARDAANLARQYKKNQ